MPFGKPCARLGGLLALIAALGAPSAAQGTGTDRWKDTAYVNAAVRAARATYAEVERAAKAKQLARLDTTISCSGSALVRVFIIEADSDGRVRRFTRVGETDAHVGKAQYYYDRDARLRFAFVQFETSSGNKAEERYYYDDQGVMARVVPATENGHVVALGPLTRVTDPVGFMAALCDTSSGPPLPGPSPEIARDTARVNSAIAEARATYDEVEAAVKRGKLVQADTTLVCEDGPGYDDDFRFRRDSSGVVRELTWSGGTDEMGVTTSYYYDRRGKLRFVLSTVGTVHGDSFTDRSYYDASGALVKFQRDVRKGHGFNALGAEPAFDPLRFFRDFCK